jgi:hypothetical protein
VTASTSGWAVECTPPGTPNVPLLLKVMDHIEHHREEWGQHHWRTCFAAHAALIDGGEWASRAGISMLARDDDPADKTWPRHYLTGDRMTIDVSDRAQHALRLTDDQACCLFASDSTLDDQRAMVAALVGEASEALR